MGAIVPKFASAYPINWLAVTSVTEVMRFCKDDKEIASSLGSGQPVPR